MKKLNSKYLVITYYKDLDFNKFFFRIFKHKGCTFFSRYSKVIEITLFHRNLIIEF